jgi:hypothetical protein
VASTVASPGVVAALPAAHHPAAGSDERARPVIEARGNATALLNSADLDRRQAQPV